MSLMPGGPLDDYYTYGRMPGMPGGMQQGAPQSAPSMDLLGGARPQFSNGYKFRQGLNGLMGNRDLAMALLANSGYGPKQSFGQILGTSMMQADQMKQKRQEDELMNQYRMAQIGALDNKTYAPNSVREFEYARNAGYKGSFEDWTKMSGQTSRPSSVQEWEFYNGLPDDQKKLYLEMKRNPNFQVKDINQVPTVVAPSYVGGTQTTPLSTTASEAAAAGQIKGAEAQAGAIGAGMGGIQAEIQKKGSNSTTVIGLIDEAEKLLPEATGSMIGTGVDKLAGAFGKSTTGAKASARLKIIQAGLMMNMPRMEGPQGEKDVLLYQEAAAQVGDSTVPVETRQAALQTIRALQQRYADRAAGASGQGGALPGGRPFKIFPNGTTDADGWTTLPGGVRVREKK